MEGDINSLVPQLVDVAGIVIALMHFLIGFVLYRDMIRMNKVVVTKNAGFFSILSISYLAFLLVILLLFVFL